MGSQIVGRPETTVISALPGLEHVTPVSPQSVVHPEINFDAEDTFK